jgi:hypothetical protein
MRLNRRQRSRIPRQPTLRASATVRSRCFASEHNLSSDLRFFEGDLLTVPGPRRWPCLCALGTLRQEWAKAIRPPHDYVSTTIIKGPWRTSIGP